MAEAAVTFLLESVQKLLEQINLVSGAENELRLLQNELELMKAFLAESAKKGELFKQHGKQIREAVYKAKDTIEACLTQAASESQKSRGFAIKNPTKRLDLAKKVKSIREEDIEPVFFRARMDFSNLPMADATLTTNPNPQTSKKRVAPIAKETIVGFEEDLIEIKGRLCGEASSGWAASGKQLLLGVLTKTLQRLITVMFVLGQQCGKIPDDCNGSRIIITTRDLNVASYVDSSNQLHKMQLLSVDQSWKLLKEKVFGQENCLPELEKVGKHIAEKCRGLPLAIVVIAGVLSKLNQMQESWEMVARNVSEAVNSSDDAQFSDILSVSYMHLPPHLRPLFLYMACFPEDYVINVSTLIRLWVAEGFVISKDKEELGYEYLEDLVRRSLVLTENKRYDGKIKAVKIHDVLRDLCLRKSREENFLCTINEFLGSFPEGVENAHRLSICSNVSGVIPNTENSPTHTILVFKHWAFDSWKSFRLVKVVHALCVKLRSSRSDSNSNSSIRYIGGLIHLRYLALRCEPITRTVTLVSESLYQLQNLQTLIVKLRVYERIIVAQGPCSDLTHEDLSQEYMKFEIWRMPQLRHLILLDGFIPDPSTESSHKIEALKNLQTLSRIKDFKCSERVLEMIPNRKKLGIIYSNEGTFEIGWSKFGLNNLAHLQKLEKLSLYAEPYPNMKNEVLSDNICFPVTLTKLTLSGCRFPWEDMGMIGSLPNLEVLKLMRRACDGTEWETSEGEFCQLRVLLIDGTDLHQWISDDSSFPMLERLTLYECESLREVPIGIGDIPTLQLIEVDIRNKSVVKSAKLIEEEQLYCGNDLLQVRFLESRSWKDYFER